MDTIVCGTDLGPSSRPAGETAAAIAARLSASVELVHALETPSVAWVAGDAVALPALAEPRHPDADALLGAEAERLGRESGARIRPLLDVSAADTALLSAVQRTRARMIVVGTHGRRAPMRWIVGSVAERLLASSPVPVLVARGDAAPFLAWGRGKGTLRVLVAADLEETFERAAMFAQFLAREGGVQLQFAHVCEPFADIGRYPAIAPVDVRRADIEASVRTELKRHAEQSGARPSADDILVGWGKPPEVLARLVNEGRFDLLVCGTHGRRGIERTLLGSIAQGIVRRSACSVLVVPTFPPGT